MPYMEADRLAEAPIASRATHAPYAHRVQYYETDQMGIVHHSNYIRWFEEARTDLLDRAGISYAEMERRGIIIPVLGVECDYKVMTRFGETALIHSRVEGFTGLRMSISYRVHVEGEASPRCTGLTRHCFLGRDLRPLKMKVLHPDVCALFDGLVREAKAR